MPDFIEMQNKARQAAQPKQPVQVKEVVEEVEETPDRSYELRELQRQTEILSKINGKLNFFTLVFVLGVLFTIIGWLSL